MDEFIIALLFPEVAFVIAFIWIIAATVVTTLMESKALNTMRDNLSDKDDSAGKGTTIITDLIFDQGIWVYVACDPAASARPADTPQAATTQSADSSNAPDTATGAPPVIDDFSPTSGDASTLVTIRGTGFTGAIMVRFNDVPAQYFRVVADDEISARPGSAATSGTISVTTASGTGMSDAVFVILAMPDITGFSNTDELQLPGDAVIITGSNFFGATSVSFGNSQVPALSFSVSADGTQITATIPAGAISGPVTVSAPGGKATSEQPVLIGSAELPAVLSFSPDTGAPLSSVSVEGAHFAGTSMVYFNGIPSGSFTLLSDSKLTAYVPDVAHLTTGPLTVKNNQGTSPAGDNFTVTPPPDDIVFDPNAGQIGETVRITGSNLGGATDVRFGDNKMKAEFNVVSDTEITAAVPSGAVNGAITVTTPSGTGNSTEGFTVLSSAPPSDLSFTPVTGSPGVAVTISGANFTGTIHVTFGDVLATPYIVQSDTQIVAYVPANATTAPIEVSNSTNPITPTKSAQVFTIYPVPAIYNANILTGVVGTPVSIFGTNLKDATSVTFGSNLTAAMPFSVSTNAATGEDTIDTTVPDGAIDGPIIVTTPGGSAKSPLPFNMQSSAAPSEITFSPTSGKAGSKVVIEGKNFLGTTEVDFFNRARSDSYHVDSDSQITARVPQDAITGPITITNNTAKPVSSSASFTVETDSGEDTK